MRNDDILGIARHVKYSTSGLQLGKPVGYTTAAHPRHNDVREKQMNRLLVALTY